MKLRFILPVLAIMVLMSSCVSKKTFLSMQDSYIQQADSLVSVTEDLNTQLSSGETDFESTKQDFMINDASKNDQIASLENQLKELQSGFDEITRTLSDTKDMYNTTQSEKDQASFQMARMNSDLVKLRQDTVSLNYAIEIERRKASSLQTSLDQQKKKNSSDVNLHKTEIANLMKDSKTSELKMKELERQLTLKQKQIDNINTGFVALRKDLLRAKSQGEPVDPNKNANISKIATAIGK